MASLLKVGYAIYPSVLLKTDKINPKTKKKTFGTCKQILFGDFIKPYIENGKYVTHKTEKEFIKVRTRGMDGYIKPEQMQANRILEVNFIDVGQGDGCHIVTPDDKHYLIDAGPADNMYRFLKWRFNLNKAGTPPPPFTVIISHSDADHYKGFDKIFSLTKGAKQQFSIDKIYHNGLVEMSGSSPDSLGTIVTKNGQDFISSLCDTDKQYKARANGGGKTGVYITTLNKSKAPKESLRFGDNPIYNKSNMKIEVLGPVAKKINNKDALPVFESNKGITKNGHSIILKLTIGHLRVLLGGDLNSPSENYLLSEFTKKDVTSIRKQLRQKDLPEATRKKLEKEIAEVITKARKFFEVDIAKSCHHGAADFTSEFMSALNPLATVVSSGDNEPHCHPRPDTLGTIGKHSRGIRSLIFSTELARSTKEFLDRIKKTAATNGTAETKKKPLTKERLVTVYGMINLRTDGEKVIIAQKLERPASGRNWDIHPLEWNKTRKEFEYRLFEKFA
jgi:beta-lactamase superfamily II metal-dependent hydrolase